MNPTAIIAPTELCSNTSRQWKDGLSTELSQREVFIDLSVTRFIDSSGLGVLLSLNKTVRARGGVLKLLNPSSAVAQLIELTRLHRVFEIVNA